MNPRDAFGVVLRTAGLLLVMYGVRTAFAIAALRAMASPDGREFGAPGLAAPAVSVLTPSLVALLALAAGAYLLRGAPALLAYSYPEAGAANRALRPARE